MGEEWRDFLTEEEIEEVELIKDWVECAAMMKKVEESGEAFINGLRETFPCQCHCMEEGDAETDGHWETPGKGMDSAIRQLLAEICRFSQRHGLCQCLYYQAASAVEKWDEKRRREEDRELAGIAGEEIIGEGVDEELPF